jgi:hypothetical protein
LRYDNWHHILANMVREYRSKDFVWGESDCVTWASNVAHAITGRDPVWWIRGQYDDQQGAVNEIYKLRDRMTTSEQLKYRNDRNKCKELIISRVVSEIYQPLDSIYYARKGDMVGTCCPEYGVNWYSLGICLGRYCGYMQDIGGLAYIPLDQIQHAWRVE